MGTDIVHELRSLEVRTDVAYHGDEARLFNSTMRAAADEIERIFRLVSRAADDLSDLQSENRSLRSERQELWRAISDMKAAAETAGLIFRNTDSGPNLVRLTPE